MNYFDTHIKPVLDARLDDFEQAIVPKRALSGRPPNYDDFITIDGRDLGVKEIDPDTISDLLNDSLGG